MRHNPNVVQSQNRQETINLLLYLVIGIAGTLFFAFQIPRKLDAETMTWILLGTAVFIAFMFYIGPWTGWLGKTGERALIATFESLDTMKARQRRDSLAISVIHHTQREDETPRKL